MNDKYCILQDDLKDCGVCCLLSIIKYYNGDMPKEYLRELTRTTKNGVTALNLIKCARELGFESYGIKGKIKDLKEEFLPLIAHVIIDKKFPHFIVIYKMDYRNNKLLVMDPAKGFYSLSYSNFINISTNYYLIMKPKQVIPKIVENSNFVDRIKFLLFQYKSVFIIIVFLSFIYTIINIINSYHFKLLYDEVFNMSEINFKVLLIFLILLIAFQVLINLYRNYLINLFNIILDKRIIYDAFYHIINLPYLYYRNHTNGDLLTRINDLGRIKNLISNFFVSVLVDLVLAVIVLIVMIKINFSLSLIPILFLFIYILVSLIYGKTITKDIQNNYVISSEVNNYLVESLISFETIKNMSIQNYIYNGFIKKYDEYNEIGKVLFKKINKENLYKGIIISLCNLFIIYFGVKLLNDNSFNITSFITFISLSNYLITPIKNLLDLHIEYQNVKESIRRIKELYQIPTEKLTDFKYKLNYLRGNIDINHVSYSYNGTDEIIKNISCEVLEGDKVLIYGKSGCGKSTLMKLLIKYLDNNYQGNITIGGYDLKNIDILSLRRSICYLSQNEYLYTDTIYENIVLGKKIKYDKFLEISNNLFINEIVKNNSLGYNLLIENNGENISGGERERILLARSLFKKANIYIYDELFSEIDVEKERKILEFIFHLYPTKTFIIISHRLSNEDLFDKILNLGGECVFVK